MGSNPDFGLVGGITRVVVYPAKTPLSKDDGEEIELHFCGSSYSEGQTWKDGQLTVKHSLTLTTPLGSIPILESQNNDALIAVATLASGDEITIGYSKRHGTNAPLRVTKTELSSGDKRVDYPLKTWLLESLDSTPLI